MLISTRDLIGYQVEGANERLGRLTDILFDEKSWGMEYLALATEENLSGRQYVSAWDIHQIHYENKTIVLAVGREALRNEIVYERKMRGALRSASKLIHMKAFVEGAMIGTVEDLILGDDSLSLESLAIRGTGDDATLHLHNIRRVEEVSEADGVIVLDKFEPFFYDTPANVWPAERKEEQLQHDIGFT